MRIVIDMQGAQTKSRFRGIGRFTISMAQGLLRLESGHEILLAFNALMPESISDIRRQLGDLLKDENVVIYHVNGPVADNVRNTWHRRVAEECYKTFLQDLQADLLFVTSYFEGYGENAVTCIAEPEFGFSTCVVVFDLIPLLNPEQYFANKGYAIHYKRKLQEIQQAKAALTISEFSRCEAIEHLSFSPEQIVNTYLGADARFRPLDLSPEKRITIMNKFDLDRPFILYTGGSDERKNLPRLVKAYAALPQKLKDTYQLLFAGKFVDGDRLYLQSLAIELGLEPRSVSFTGYISDETLIELYNLCSLFVFPSWHEGFGLPVLEAMACGVPAIAGRCSSLPEVLAFPEALFDPFDVEDISQTIARFLINPDLRLQLISHNREQVKVFSWDKSAAIAMAKFNQILSLQQTKSVIENVNINQSIEINYRRLVDRIGLLSSESYSPDDQDLMRVALCIESNQNEARRINQRIKLTDKSLWCLPTDHVLTTKIDSDSGVDKPIPAITRALVESRRNLIDVVDDADVLLAPQPRSDSRQHKLQMCISYGLRLAQSKVPENLLVDLNLNARGAIVSSHLLRKLLIDEGVCIPIEVVEDGVDEWMSLSGVLNESLQTKKYRFICDVSNVTEDGLDVLLSSYGQAFDAEANVSVLVIGEENVISEISDCVATWRTNSGSLAEVEIVCVDNDILRKGLYQSAQCLVAPYRFRDVCLPCVRALAMGLPVLVTGWGQQTDLERSHKRRFIDYQFVRSRDFERVLGGYRVEPSREHLAQLLIEQSKAECKYQDSLEPVFPPRTWTKANSEIIAFVDRCSSPVSQRPARIGWVTTWNARCGIATYSEHMIDCISDDVMIFAPRNTEQIASDCMNVTRCWDLNQNSLSDLQQALFDAAIDTIVIQFNYGFFQFAAFIALLDSLNTQGARVVVEMHSTSDPVHDQDRRLEKLAPALRGCYRLLVHSIADLNRLKQIGLTENVTLFPHGIKVRLPVTKPPEDKKKSDCREKPFLLATYGFFLPHKGLLEIIDVIAMLRSLGHNLHLNMLNAAYPDPESEALIQQARKKIKSLDLGRIIKLNTAFLSDQESFEHLSQADLIVYPYQATGESASGAVRFGLATMRPVAVTPLQIFDDVRPMVFTLPGCSTQDLAYGVRDLIKNLKTKTNETIQRANANLEWCATYQYPKVAAKLVGILKSHN